MGDQEAPVLAQPAFKELAVVPKRFLLIEPEVLQSLDENLLQAAVKIAVEVAGRESGRDLARLVETDGYGEAAQAAGGRDKDQAAHLAQVIKPRGRGREQGVHPEIKIGRGRRVV